MKWAGCFSLTGAVQHTRVEPLVEEAIKAVGAKPHIALAPNPPLEAEAAHFMMAHRHNHDTSEALDDLVQLLHRVRGPHP
jgi:hypothetical protein